MTSDPPEPPVSNNRVSFTPTLGDVCAAKRRVTRDWLWRWKALVAWAMISTGAVLTMVVVDPFGSRIADAVMCGSGATGGFLMSRIMPDLLVPLAARRLYRQQAGLRTESTYEWDAEGIGASSRRGHGRTAWTEYLRWREDRAVILLYHSDELTTFLPKRALTAEQIATLRGYGASAGLPGAARKLR